jgi:hypothetical protein
MWEKSTPFETPQSSRSWLNLEYENMKANLSPLETFQVAIG